MCEDFVETPPLLNTCSLSTYVYGLFLFCLALVSQSCGFEVAKIIGRIISSTPHRTLFVLKLLTFKSQTTLTTIHSFKSQLTGLYCQPFSSVFDSVCSWLSDGCDKLKSVFFTLAISGSTGKPKGVLHTVGGYMLYTAVTFK